MHYIYLLPVMLLLPLAQGYAVPKNRPKRPSAKLVLEPGDTMPLRAQIGAFPKSYMSISPWTNFVLDTYPSTTVSTPSTKTLAAAATNTVFPVSSAPSQAPSTPPTIILPAPGSTNVVTFPRRRSQIGARSTVSDACDLLQCLQSADQNQQQS